MTDEYMSPNLQILLLFIDTFGPADVISGGQFLAALRLLVHAQNGGDILESNVFAQSKYSSICSHLSFIIEPNHLFIV